MTEVNIYKLRLLSVKSVAAFQVAELFEALFVWVSDVRITSICFDPRFPITLDWVDFFNANHYFQNLVILVVININNAAYSK